MLLLAFSVLYLAALAGLLWVTRHRRRYYAQAKGFCSLLFLGAAVLAFALGTRTSVGRFAVLMAALVLCAMGDVLLGLANRAKKVRARPFLAGAVSFGLAHVLFCTLLVLMAGFALYDLALPALLLLTLFLLEKRDLVRLKKMRVPGYIYTFLVGLMCAMALRTALPILPQSPVQGALLSVGATLFLASDVVLLFLYFGTRRHKWYRFANLITYYIGVYLMALCAFWM